MFIFNYRLKAKFLPFSVFFLNCTFHCSVKSPDTCFYVSVDHSFNHCSWIFFQDILPWHCSKRKCVIVADEYYSKSPGNCSNTMLSRASEEVKYTSYTVLCLYLRYSPFLPCFPTGNRTHIHIFMLAHVWTLTILNHCAWMKLLDTWKSGNPVAKTVERFILNTVGKTEGLGNHDLRLKLQTICASFFWF